MCSPGAFSATLITFLGVGAVVPALPRYVTGPLEGGEIAVGIVMGSFAFTAVFLRPVEDVSPISAAGGRSPSRARRSTAIAGCLYLLPLDIPGLILARLVLGVGEGWLYTAAAAWVVDVTPEERRGETIGIFGMSIWLGLSLGPPIGEALRAIGGFDLVWAFAAVAPAVGAVVAARTPEQTGMSRPLAPKACCFRAAHSCPGSRSAAQ